MWLVLAIFPSKYAEHLGGCGDGNPLGYCGRDRLRLTWQSALSRSATSTLIIAILYTMAVALVASQPSESQLDRTSRYSECEHLIHRAVRAWRICGQSVVMSPVRFAIAVRRRRCQILDDDQLTYNSLMPGIYQCQEMRLKNVDQKEKKKFYGIGCEKWCRI